MKDIYFYVKNKNYKKERPYDSPIIGKILLSFFDADFVLDALGVHKPVKWLYVSEDDFISILRILEDWRKCFDTLDFSKVSDYKWEGRLVYDPIVKSKLDNYISDMNKILKDFDWKHLEMTVEIC